MEVLSNIGFDWQVALANFVSFLIIFVVLKTWVFGPVSKIIDERKQKIQEALTQAQNSQEERERVKKEAEHLVNQARGEAQDIIVRAKTQGDKLIERSELQAKEEAQATIKRAQQSIEEEKQQVEKELLAHTADLISQGVQKVLKRDIHQQEHDILIKQDLEALNNTQS